MAAIRRDRLDPDVVKSLEASSKLMKQIADAKKNGKPIKGLAQTIVTRANRIIALVEGVAEYHPHAKAAVGCYKAIIKLDMNKQTNSEQVAVVCHSMTLLVYNLLTANGNGAKPQGASRAVPVQNNKQAAGRTQGNGSQTAMAAQKARTLINSKLNTSSAGKAGTLVKTMNSNVAKTTRSGLVKTTKTNTTRTTNTQQVDEDDEDEDEDDEDVAVVSDEGDSEDQDADEDDEDAAVVSDEDDPEVDDDDDDDEDDEDEPEVSDEDDAEDQDDDDDDAGDQDDEDEDDGDDQDVDADVVDEDDESE